MTKCRNSCVGFIMLVKLLVVLVIIKYELFSAVKLDKFKTYLKLSNDINLLAYLLDDKTLQIYNYDYKNSENNFPISSKDLLVFTFRGQPKKILCEVKHNFNKANSKLFEIEKLDLANDLPIKVFYIPKKTELPLSVHWKILDEFFYYNGNDLGCNLSKQSNVATFTLWAPLAEYVKLLLYDKQDQNKLLATFVMNKKQKGIWQFTLSIDLLSQKINSNSLEGYFYQFLVKNPGRKPKLVLDPYAKSMAVFTVDTTGTKAENTNDFVGKAAIVNPSSVNIEITPLDLGKYYRNRQDAIIYEIHVRDFTSDPSIAAKLKSRWGTFSAFCEMADYIKSLGVTHVQLLPIMSWYYGDESKMHIRELKWSSSNNNYNWGYDPHSYFSIDGAYSELPDDPVHRIREFKKLIDCLHRKNLGVILDVVYTHMAKADILEDIVADYFFFKDENFNYLGDFGNNLAVNRKMVKKLILDSVKFWFDEYKIDGMRFDMMGDATQCLIEEAYNVAKSINKKAIFIGEGWRTFKGHLADSSLVGKGADQDWMAFTDCVGVFSDEFRNEIKSGFGCEGEPRFVTNGPRNLEKLYNAIIGKPSNIPTTSPIDVVQYVEAHDNLTLHDVIAISIKKDPYYYFNTAEIHKRIRIANALLLLSQGTVFIHAGQEYGRTKQWRALGIPEKKYYIGKDKYGNLFKFPYFINDSYDSSDAINMIEWQKISDFTKYPEEVKTKNYTIGLISLRKSTDAFRHPSFKEIDQNVKFIPIKNAKENDLVLCFKTISSRNEVYKVLINADNVRRDFILPEDEMPKNFEILVDSENSGISSISVPKGVLVSKYKVTLNPLTVAVFKENYKSSLQ